MKTKTKPEPKTPELPGVAETYNDEISKAMHDLKAANDSMAEAYEDREQVVERLLTEMHKAKKKIVVMSIDGTQYVAELKPSAEKIRFAKAQRLD
jgi:hypothetical protein